MEYKSSDDMTSRFETTKPINNFELNKEVEDKIEWCIQTIQPHHDLLKLPTIKFEWSLRGAVAGRATRPKDGVAWMRLHYQLAVRNKEDYINSTVPHEVAHIITRHIFPGSTTHGPGWIHMMQLLGLPAERCHDYDVSDIQKKMPRPYIYKCRCREHSLTHILHNRIQSGSWRKCTRCRVRIEFDRVA